MLNFICTSCGTQHAQSDQPPASCGICQDERQYIKKTGQQWTTLDRLRLTNRNSIRFKEPGLLGVSIDPHFAIGQRALFLRTPSANVLWDYLPLLDEAVVEALKALGGISAVAIAHPHYYSSMVEWSRAFGGVPIYLHAADRQWVMRPDEAIVCWDGETRTLGEGLTRVRCGGHFDGGTVLHWAGGAEGRGALLTGDIIQVVPDRKHVSFMYSYPNYKGNEYTVLGVALHSETQEELVVYRQEYADYGLWVPPKQMFLETVTVDGKAVPRFQYLGGQE